MRCEKHKMYHNPCIICQEIQDAKDDAKEYFNKTKQLNQVIKKRNIQLNEQSKELEEMSTDLEQALNLAHKSYDPTAKLKLSVNDMVMVRGIFTANSFLFNSLTAIDDCIINKKDETTKQQLTLIKKDLEKEWDRVVGLLDMFAKEFSKHNWDRMIREVQKIVKVTAETMNQRDLGCFMVTKEGEYISQEYKVRPLVVKAIEACLHSAGTNQLTAYSKEELVKSIIKICEDK